MGQVEKEENPANGKFLQQAETGRLLRKGYMRCWVSQVMEETSKGHKRDYDLLKHWKQLTHWTENIKRDILHIFIVGKYRYVYESLQFLYCEDTFRNPYHFSTISL